MDFSKVNKGQVSFNISFSGVENDKKPASNENKIQETGYDSKAPLEPQYWQALKGVSNDSKQDIEKAIEETYKKMQASIYFCDRREDSAKYKEKLINVSKNGVSAIENYGIIFDSACSIYLHDERERFLVLADDLFELVPNVSKDDVKYLASIFKTLVYKPKDFEEKRSLLKSILSEPSYSIEDKKKWLMERVLPQINDIEDWDKFIEDSASDLAMYNEFRGFFEEKSEAPYNCSSNLHFDGNDFSKLLNLLKSGAIKPEAFEGLINETSYMLHKYEEPVKSIISMLDSDFKEGENSRFRAFDTLALKMTSRKITPDVVQNLLEENSSIKKEALEYFRPHAENATDFYNAPFYDVETFLNTLNFLDEDNFQDYKTIFEKETETKSPAKASHELTAFNNSKTKLFDKEIYLLAKEFDKKNEEIENNNAFSGFYSNQITDTAKCAASCIDIETGKPNKAALDFINKYSYEDIDKKHFFNKKKKSNKNIRAFYSNNCFGFLVPDLIEYMKDSKGRFNSVNIKYVNKIAEMELMGYFPDMKLFNMLKNEDGIVDKEKFQTMAEYAKYLDAETLVKTFEAKEYFGSEVAENILYSMTEMFESETCALRNYAECAPCLFSKEGEANEENCEFATALLKDDDSLVLPKRIFEIAKNEENKELFLELNKQTELITDDIHGVMETFDEFKDEKGNLPPFVKHSILEAAKNDVPLFEFPKVFKKCISDNENIENNFDSKAFNDIINIFKNEHSLYSKLSIDEMFDLVKGKVNPGSMSFKRKVKLLEAFRVSKLNEPYLAKAITDIDNSLSVDNISLEISNKNKKRF